MRLHIGQGVTEDAGQTSLVIWLPRFGPRRAVPESLGHEKEQKAEAEAHDYGDNPKTVRIFGRPWTCLRDLPEHPSPIFGTDDDSTDQRNQILPTQEKKGINTDSKGAFMQEEDLCNGGRRQTFHWTDRNALEHSSGGELGVAGCHRTPDGGDNEQDGRAEIHGAFAPEDGRGGEDDTAHTEAHHVESRRQGHPRVRHVVSLGDVVEASSKDRGHSSADHTVEAKGQQGNVPSPCRPVQRVVQRVVWLRIQNELAISCLFLGRVRRTSQGRGERLRGHGGRAPSSMLMLESEGFIAVGGQEEDGPGDFLSLLVIKDPQ